MNAYEDQVGRNVQTSVHPTILITYSRNTENLRPSETIMLYSQISQTNGPYLLVAVNATSILVRTVLVASTAAVNATRDSQSNAFSVETVSSAILYLVSAVIWSCFI